MRGRAILGCPCPGAVASYSLVRTLPGIKLPGRIYHLLPKSVQSLQRSHLCSLCSAAPDGVNYIYSRSCPAAKSCHVPLHNAAVLLPLNTGGLFWRSTVSKC